MIGTLQVITSKEDAYNQNGNPTTTPYPIIFTLTPN